MTHSKFIIITFSILLLSCYSQAYDVLVSVKGKLVSETCVVSSNSKDMTIDFGNISARQFVLNGVANTKKSFTINLEDCGSDFSGVKVRFTGIADKNHPSFIKNNDKGAKGIAIKLLNESQEIVALGEQSQVYRLVNSEGVSINYFAQLVANGEKVEPGTISALSTWTLEYL